MSSIHALSTGYSQANKLTFTVIQRNPNSNFRDPENATPDPFILTVARGASFQALSFLPLLAYYDEVTGLTICKTALMVLMACKAVNNRLCDKPLDLRERWRKGFRAKTGYEIHGDTGCGH